MLWAKYEILIRRVKKRIKTLCLFVLQTCDHFETITDMVEELIFDQFCC